MVFNHSFFLGCTLVTKTKKTSPETHSFTSWLLNNKPMLGTGNMERTLFSEGTCPPEVKADGSLQCGPVTDEQQEGAGGV